MKYNRILALLLAVITIAGCLAACNTGGGNVTTGTTDAASTESATESSTGGSNELAPFVDYVDQLKLDMSSPTKKAEVTMKQHIDGDTTHFFISNAEMDRGFIKARYLAVNTPESTGQI